MVLWEGNTMKSVGLKGCMVFEEGRAVVYHMQFILEA